MFFPGLPRLVKPEVAMVAGLFRSVASVISSRGCVNSSGMAE